MPAGDPAGYLPNVLKSRKRKSGYGPRRGSILKPGVSPSRQKIAPPGFKPGKPKLPKPGDAGSRKYFSRQKRAA